MFRFGTLVSLVNAQRHDAIAASRNPHRVRHLQPVEAERFGTPIMVTRGSDDRRDNRTTVCAAHHLHGLDAGTVRASGVTPHAIEWQLGVRPGTPPFLTYVGDRLCQPADTRNAAGAPRA